MHQALRVRMSKRLQHGLRDLEGFVDRVVAAAAQGVRERLPFDEGHDVEDQAFTIAREMNRHDGWVVQTGEGLGLLPEAGQHARRPRDFGMEDLAGQTPIQILVPQLVHLGEPAPADQPLHLVLGAERVGEALGGVPHFLPRHVPPLRNGEGVRG